MRYDPREQDVEVKAGDNRGAIVAQQNVVRQLDPAGRRGAAGRRPSRRPPPTEKGLKTVVIVQGVRGGPILGATDGPTRKP